VRHFTQQLKPLMVRIMGCWITSKW